MNVEAVAEDEALAGENAHRVLDLIQSGRREELVEFINGLTRGELSMVVLAIGAGLLEQEARNDEVEIRCGMITAQNRTLEEGNARLFAERRRLMDKVAELRDVVHQREKKAA